MTENNCFNRKYMKSLEENRDDLKIKKKLKDFAIPSMLLDKLFEQPPASCFSEDPEKEEAFGSDFLSVLLLFNPLAEPIPM